MPKNDWATRKMGRSISVASSLGKKPAYYQSVIGAGRRGNGEPSDLIECLQIIRS